jgi:hypothetical protein
VFWKGAVGTGPGAVVFWKGAVGTGAGGRRVVFLGGTAVFLGGIGAGGTGTPVPVVTGFTGTVDSSQTVVVMVMVLVWVMGIVRVLVPEVTTVEVTTT